MLIKLKNLEPSYDIINSLNMIVIFKLRVEHTMKMPYVASKSKGDTESKI